MLLLTMYTVSNIYSTSYQNVYEVGSDKTTAITADLEKYLENAKSVLWVTADTIDHMIAQGATHDEIVAYITRESVNTETQFDSTYTGLYGVFNGEYADGLGWVPPEGYDPTQRDWYKAAVEANGQVIITSPYVESVSGDVVISVCKTLSDSEDVLGLDLALTGVQDTVEDVQINGTGYGVILNNDGMIIANPNKELKDTVNKPGAATVPDLMKTTDKGTKAAVSGGQRNTTVNIHIQDMVKEINFNGTLQENEDDLVNRVSECMTRVLYATAQLE